MCPRKAYGLLVESAPLDRARLHVLACQMLHEVCVVEYVTIVPGSRLRVLHYLLGQDLNIFCVTVRDAFQNLYAHSSFHEPILLRKSVQDPSLGVYP